MSRINRERGVTILLTTHDLRDIEELCERVMVINHGRLVFDGSLQSLHQQARLPARMIVEYGTMIPRNGSWLAGKESGELLVGPGGGNWNGSGILRIVEGDPVGRTVTVEFDRTQVTVPEALRMLQAVGEIRDVRLAEPGIEEVIKWLLTREEARVERV